MYSAELPASPAELALLTNKLALKLNAEGTDPHPFNSTVCPAGGSFITWTSSLGNAAAVAVINTGNRSTCRTTTVAFGAIGPSFKTSS